MTRHLNIGISLIALGVAIFPYGASAVEAAPAAAQAGQDTGITEVVVTAQRRKENVQKVPLAIEALSNDSLKKAGVSNVTDMSRLVPAAQFGSSAGPNPQLFVRGVGSNTGTAMTDAAVSVSYDGVPAARSYHATTQYFDLERVEVLIGPQGTLYGRNATGGAINIVPAKPKLGQASTDLGVELGSYNAVKLGGAFNIPLSDKAAMRLAFQSEQNDGYWSQDAGATKRLGLRGQVLYVPSENLSVLLGLDYGHQGGTATNGVSTVGMTTLNIPIPGPVPHVITFDVPTAGFQASDGVSTCDPRLTSIFAAQALHRVCGKDQADNGNGGLTAQINYTTDAGTLTIIPSARVADLNFLSYGVGFGLDQDEYDAQHTLEARFSSPDSNRLKWIVGGFYLFDHVKSHMIIDTFAPAFLGTSIENHFTVDTKSAALFVDGTYKLTDSFKLIAGGRYTVDEKTPTGTLFTSNSPVPVSLDNTPTKKWSAFTYRGGAEWDVTAASIVYATYSTGWHSGGFSFTHDDPVYNPETLDALTIGSKNRFLDNKLQANIELYDWKYHDQQTSFLAVDSAGATVFVTKNVGESTRKGVDLDLKYRLFANTTLGAHIGYLEAAIQKFQYQVSSANPLLTGCNVLYTGGPSMTVDCAGKTVPFSPRWTQNYSIEQRVPLPNGSAVTIGLFSHSQSDMITGTQIVDAELQKAYTTYDATLRYTPATGGWAVEAYGENISDEIIKGQTFQSTASGILGAQQAMYFTTLRPPARYGVRLTTEF